MWRIIYFVIINIVTFAVFVFDKKAAIKHRYRVSEAVLFGLSLIGGALGGLIAMYSVRHKIRKTGFVIGMPVILILNLVVLFWVVRGQI